MATQCMQPSEIHQRIPSFAHFQEPKRGFIFSQQIFPRKAASILATPMVIGECKDPEKEIVQTAVQGTLNVLESCKKAESVRRVVFTSSFAAALPLGKSLVVIDESCWTSLDVIRKTSSQMRFYRESKTLAEKAALQFGKENPPLDVVSILLPVVAGPSMTSTAPSSVNAMLSLITDSMRLLLLVLTPFHRRNYQIWDSIINTVWRRLLTTASSLFKTWAYLTDM